MEMNSWERPHTSRSAHVEPVAAPAAQTCSDERSLAPEVRAGTAEQHGSHLPLALGRRLIRGEQDPREHPLPAAAAQLVAGMVLEAGADDLRICDDTGARLDEREPPRGRDDKSGHA